MFQCLTDSKMVKTERLNDIRKLKSMIYYVKYKVLLPKKCLRFITKLIYSTGKVLRILVLTLNQFAWKAITNEEKLYLYCITQLSSPHTLKLNPTGRTHSQLLTFTN